MYSSSVPIYSDIPGAVAFILTGTHPGSTDRSFFVVFQPSSCLWYVDEGLGLPVDTTGTGTRKTR